MPKSKVRQKAAYTPPPAKKQAVKIESGRLVPGLMVAFFLVGLAWIVVYYLSGQNYPIGSLAGWNIAIGFAAIAVGFGISTRWK